MLNSRAIFLLTVAIAFCGFYFSSIVAFLSEVAGARIAGTFAYPPRAPGSAPPNVHIASSMPSYRAPLVIPAIGRHTATVIFAHGLGDTGHGWSDVVQAFQRNGRLNEVKFILPHAPVIPITVVSPYSRFTDVARRPKTQDPAYADKPFAMARMVDIPHQDGTDLMNPKDSEEDEEGIRESRKYLQSLIDNEIERNGIPSGRIVLGGFSQGGAMSIFTGLTSPVKLGGVVALSCWLLLNSKFKSFLPEGDVNKQTPVFMGHGDADPLVRYQWGQATQKALTDLGFSVDLKAYR
ncbi:Acyl-protein thioesterase 1 [Escovopsis weberi]|uniref:Acyl-protein thioesterase 1 n=1 Tax=Escovopsis weberi TaxID=150374 RepID=A0A0M9VTE3_ESCWE|nr:Acyl-protein thioesterase 1 [Escovopsis weberi]